MNKASKRFNGMCSRYAFWHTLTAKLAEFDSLMKHKEHLTPEDVKAQKWIHQALYRCYMKARKMREHHREELRRQITHDHRRTTNKSCKH